MNERYFHLANWQNAAEAEGVEFATYWSESNYWRVKTEGEIRAREDSLPSVATPTDVLDQMMRPRADLLKEFIFEHVRSQDYGSMPSRRACMFLSRTAAEPSQFARRLGWDLEGKTLLEVETLAGVTHAADVRLLDCNMMSYIEMIREAHKYWGEPCNAPEHTEVLFRGAFRVVKVHKVGDEG